MDYDHPMESVQWGHHDRVMPFCVRDIVVKDSNGTIIAHVRDNHSSKVQFSLDKPIVCNSLNIELENTLDQVPVSIFGIVVK